MSIQKLQEAQNNAEAAAINLSTACQHLGRKDMIGTLRNARSQLAKAMRLMDEWEAELLPGAPVKFAGDMPGDMPTASTPKPTWTKVPGGIELAQHGPYQVSVTGMRGDWYYSVAKSGTATPLRQGNAKTKKLAQNEGTGWANELADEDARRATRLRSAGVGFDRLEAALENARSGFASDRRSCSYEGSAPATLDDVHNIVDSFVASLIHSLDPEPG